LDTNEKSGALFRYNYILVLSFNLNILLLNRVNTLSGFSFSIGFLIFVLLWAYVVVVNIF